MLGVSKQSANPHPGNARDFTFDEEGFEAFWMFTRTNTVTRTDQE